MADESLEGTTDAPAVWCIVVAAGSGARFGAVKQFSRLGGVRVVDRAVSTARAACDGVVVVVPADAMETDEARIPGADAVVAGGSSRSDSVRFGLEAVPDDAEIVLVHDAARPLASKALFERVIDAVSGGSAAVIPAMAVVDTIRSVDVGVVDRSRLRAVQTPQGFRSGVLRAAHVKGADATDDAGLVETLGVAIRMVDGERHNTKLTESDDLAVAEALIALAGDDGSLGEAPSSIDDPGDRAAERSVAGDSTGRTVGGS